MPRFSEPPIGKPIKHPEEVKAYVVELTPELRAKFMKTACKIVNLLMSETKGPVESLIILQFAIDALQETMGATYHGTMMIDKDEKEV